MPCIEHVPAKKNESEWKKTCQKDAGEIADKCDRVAKSTDGTLQSVYHCTSQQNVLGNIKERCCRLQRTCMYFLSEVNSSMP